MRTGRARSHLVVFFIVLVANAGGRVSPLGDPPLYIGFLHGVPFFWPLSILRCRCWWSRAAAARASMSWTGVSPPPTRRRPKRERFRLRGWANVALIGVVVATVLAQGIWRPGEVVLFGQEIGIERLAGDRRVPAR